jgi:hypothetical protein
VRWTQSTLNRRLLDREPAVRVSEAFGAELLFYFIVLDSFFSEEPSLPRTGYFKIVATIQLV